MIEKPPMAVASILLSVLSLYTFWLVLPMFVLPPIAFCLGLLSHRANRAKNRMPTKLAVAFSMFPMLLSVAAFWFEIYLMATEYRV